MVRLYPRRGPNSICPTEFLNSKTLNLPYNTKLNLIGFVQERIAPPNQFWGKNFNHVNYGRISLFFFCWVLRKGCKIPHTNKNTNTLSVCMYMYVCSVHEQFEQWAFTSIGGGRERENRDWNCPWRKSLTVLSTPHLKRAFSAYIYSLNSFLP